MSVLWSRYVGCQSVPLWLSVRSSTSIWPSIPHVYRGKPWPRMVWSGLTATLIKSDAWTRCDNTTVIERLTISSGNVLDTWHLNDDELSRPYTLYRRALFHEWHNPLVNSQYGRAWWARTSLLLMSLILTVRENNVNWLLNRGVRAIHGTVGDNADPTVNNLPRLW